MLWLKWNDEDYERLSNLFVTQGTEIELNVDVWWQGGWVGGWLHTFNWQSVCHEMLLHTLRDVFYSKFSKVK